jgi:hypothetical protein
MIEEAQNIPVRTAIFKIPSSQYQKAVGWQEIHQGTPEDFQNEFGDAILVSVFSAGARTADIE